MMQSEGVVTVGRGGHGDAHLPVGGHVNVTSRVVSADESACVSVC